MKLFRLDTEAVIINEVVINEVRLRECLWNPRNAYYKNKTERYKAWEEVAVAVLPKYTTCSEDNKRRIVRAVQSRWETALNAYMKCRLPEIKKPTYKARQQRFIYNKLKFLERVKDLFEDKDKDVNNSVTAPDSAGGDADATARLAAGQAAVRPACLTKESPNKRAPLGKNRRSVLCVTFKENEEDSNSYAGDNSESQSTTQFSTDSDDNHSEASDEIMDYDIDIHDDFKEKIKDLVYAFDEIDDKAVSDNNKQECLPGTSSQNNYQKDPLATADVTKPQKKCTSANTSNLQTDDQLFFNSLTPLIDKFDIHQKRMLRSKIMDAVMEVGKIGPLKNIKQERET